MKNAPTYTEMKIAARRLEQAWEDEKDVPESQRLAWLAVSVWLKTRESELRDRSNARRIGCTLSYYRKNLKSAT